jgi:hypothetical protein
LNLKWHPGYLRKLYLCGIQKYLWFHNSIFSLEENDQIVEFVENYPRGNGENLTTRLWKPPEEVHVKGLLNQEVRLSQ